MRGGIPYLRPMRKMLLYCLVLLYPAALCAQGDVRDTAVAMSIISVYGAGNSNFADLDDRFGSSASVGLGYHYKSGSNWVFGAEGHFIFGNRVRGAGGLLREARTETGQILTNQGRFASILILQRGMQIQATVGKIFPVISPNPNSGPLLRAGVGFLEHRIYFEARQEDVNAIERDILAGYDRLSSGLAFTQFVGYQLMSNNRLANFYAGVEFTQGLTRERRAYSIDEMRPTLGERRFDGMVSFRLGWTLLIYKKAPDEFYFY